MKNLLIAGFILAKSVVCLAQSDTSVLREVATYIATPLALEETSGKQKKAGQMTIVVNPITRTVKFGEWEHRIKEIHKENSYFVIQFTDGWELNVTPSLETCLLSTGEARIIYKFKVKL